MYPRKYDSEHPEWACQEMTRLAEEYLPLQKWGFKQSAFVIDIDKCPNKIIYDSEWCRVMLSWEWGDRFRDNANIKIFYGRLHAPDNQGTIYWNDKVCYCWHFVHKTALNFLDDLSPQESTNESKITFKTARIVEEFQKSDLGKSIDYSPERSVRLHANIWEHYKLKLFELFDLRRPDLWEDYSQFVKEYYDIIGRISHMTPHQDMIC